LRPPKERERERERRGTWTRVEAAERRSGEKHATVQLEARPNAQVRRAGKIEGVYATASAGEYMEV
jgi:hypothetical protein